MEATLQRMHPDSRQAAKRYLAENQVPQLFEVCQIIPGQAHSGPRLDLSVPVHAAEGARLKRALIVRLLQFYYYF